MKPELEKAMELVRQHSDGAFITAVDNKELVTRYNLNPALLLETARRVIDIILMKFVDGEKLSKEVKIVSSENGSVN